MLAAKQRAQQPNDWMTTDAEVACPDPHCKSRLRIVRTGLRTFSHGEVTAVPLQAVQKGERGVEKQMKAGDDSDGILGGARNE